MLTVDDIRIGTELFETYTVRGEVSEDDRGGTAKVWRTYDMSNDIELALKCPNSETVGTAEKMELFRKECLLWASLGKSKHIVKCFYVRDLGGIPVIFSEWVYGGSLKNLIEKGEEGLYKGSPAEQLARIIHIADNAFHGIAFAHSKGIIHKDIKPANIMLTSSGNALLTDFGSAMSPEACTIPYRSPEQAEGGDITEKTDLYSWALTLAEMLIGKRIWSDGSEVTDFSDMISDYFIEELSEQAQEEGLYDDLSELISGCLELRLDGSQAAALLKKISHEASDEDETADNEVVSPEILNNQALSFLCMGDEEKAEKAWEQSLRIQPAHSDSLINREMYHLQTGRTNEHEVKKLFEGLNPADKKRALSALSAISCEENAAERAGANEISADRIRPDIGSTGRSYTYREEKVRPREAQSGGVLSDNVPPELSESVILVNKARSLELCIDKEKNTVILKNSDTGHSVRQFRGSAASFDSDGMSFIVYDSQGNEAKRYKTPERSDMTYIFSRELSKEEEQKVEELYRTLRSEWKTAIDDGDANTAARIMKKIHTAKTLGTMTAAELSDRSEKIVEFKERWNDAIKKDEIETAAQLFSVLEESGTRLPVSEYIELRYSITDKYSHSQTSISASADFDYEERALPGSRVCFSENGRSFLHILAGKEKTRVFLMRPSELLRICGQHKDTKNSFRMFSEYELTPPSGFSDGNIPLSAGFDSSGQYVIFGGGTENSFAYNIMQKNYSRQEGLELSDHDGGHVDAELLAFCKERGSISAAQSRNRTVLAVCSPDRFTVCSVEHKELFDKDTENAASSLADRIGACL